MKINKSIMKHFIEISKIPRSSYNEKLVSEYIIKVAKSNQLNYKTDEIHNVIIYKRAYKGYESKEPVILQGHMDMVAVKKQNSIHDFFKDPLNLYIENSHLKAKDTTLGADNGCGIAYMLAILEDITLKHPALECVFTVQEEVGLIGAQNIKKEDLSGTRMISLDNGEENTVCTTSSGGRMVYIRGKFHTSYNRNNEYSLTVHSLLGGHSGIDIDKGRINANILMIQIMYNIMKKYSSIRIIKIDGGEGANAISRNCKIHFSCINSYQELQRFILDQKKVINDTDIYEEKRFYLTLKKEMTKNDALSIKDSLKVIKLLNALPNGIIERSFRYFGLINGSLSMGLVKYHKNNLEVVFTLRAPSLYIRDYLYKKISCISDLAECECIMRNDYNGWEFEENNTFRKQYINFVQEYEHIELRLGITHGGLEAGVFKGLKPELEIVTLGPDMYDIHTPDEKLSLLSFQKCYNRLINFLATL